MGTFPGVIVPSWLSGHSLASIIHGGLWGTQWPPVAVQLPILLGGIE